MRLAAAAAMLFAVGGLCIVAAFVPVLLSSYDEAVAITVDVHRTVSVSLRDSIADNVRRSTTALQDLAAFYGRDDTWPSTAAQIDYLVRLYNHTGSMIEQVHTGRALNGDFVSLYRKQEPYRPYWRLSVRNATVPCRRSFDLDLDTRGGPFIPGTERCSYDPRLRSWYAGLNTVAISSTLPEPMSDYPGVRVYIGRRVTGLFDASVTLGVVHIDITTEFLVTALRRNPIGKSGVAWLSALSGTTEAVYAISWDGESTTDLSRYNASALNPIVGVKNVSQLEHPLVRAAVASLGAATFQEDFSGQRLLEHREDGRIVTIADIPTPQAPTLQLRLSVVIKESDYLSDIEQHRTTSIVVAVAVVVVVAAVMSVIMWRIAAPLTLIADGMHDVAALKATDAAAAHESIVGTASVISEVTALQDSYTALHGELDRLRAFVPASVLVAHDADEYDADLAQSVSRSEVSRFSFETSGSNAADGSERSVARSRRRGGQSPSGSAFGRTGSGTDPSGSLPAGALNTAVSLQRRNVAVLMVNCVGFNKAIRGLSALETHTKYTAFVEAMTSAITAEKGVVEHWNGDHFTASFNGSRPIMQPAAKAAHAALSIGLEAAPRTLNIPVAMGIATGRVEVGNLGCASAMRFCILGGVVPLADTLVRWAPEYDADGPTSGCELPAGTRTLLCPNTVSELETQFVVRRIDYRRSKPKAKPALVAELVAARDHATAQEWLYVVGGNGDRVENQLFTLIHTGRVAAAREAIDSIKAAGDTGTSALAPLLRRAETALVLVAEATHRRAATETLTDPSITNEHTRNRVDSGPRAITTAPDDVRAMGQRQPTPDSYSPLEALPSAAVHPAAVPSDDDGQNEPPTTSDS